ncbi:hypothetical protein [Janibacter anophelis]|uniref:hypothetical protein n=1 Tax=Janibacter anophelis TaxID=319054 RepID=UPI00083465AC|nr:hypothetical protein [Janibacter anophelis]
MTSQMPAWAVWTLLVVLLVWSIAAGMWIERRLLTWWVGQTAGGLLRTVVMTAVLHLAIVLGCLVVAVAVVWLRDALGVGTWVPGLAAFVGAAAVTPAIANFLPSHADLGPYRDDLVRAGAAGRQATAIRWTSLPFVMVELACLTGVGFAALAT